MLDGVKLPLLIKSFFVMVNKKKKRINKESILIKAEPE